MCVSDSTCAYCAFVCRFFLRNGEGSGDPSTAMAACAAGPVERFCATFDINRVAQLVREHEGDVKTASKDVVMFIGESQSGKSTLINGLLGVPLKEVEDECCGEMRIEIDKDIPYAGRFSQIGNGAETITMFPTAYPSYRDGSFRDLVFLKDSVIQTSLRMERLVMRMTRSPLIF